jgi:hypothetical protein
MLAHKIRPSPLHPDNVLEEDPQEPQEYPRDS